MKFINNTKEEETICFNCETRRRENSNKINYFNRVNEKPWGKEYLAYQSKYIGIWILHVNKDQETSLHCHFKKDTILMPIVGCFKINLFDKFSILNLLDTLYVPRETFHGIHSYVDDSILMEIEIYTDKIEYTDKSDLLRIKDIYNRDKNNYERSVVEREPYENEIMYFNTNNKYNINNTYLEILKIKNIEEIRHKYDVVLLLQGSIFSDGKKITSGSFIDLKNQTSILTEYIELLCISNINIKQLQKIIYSKNHLTDYLELNKFNNIGLTSGCFDILHEGHITNLKLCKKNCDHLFVCLSSDKQIKRLKGELRPINNLIDRINMLIHYDFIDIIILYDETNDELESELDNIMNIVKSYIWFKGSDYNKQDILKKHPNIKNIQLFDLIKGKSTTNIIQKIIT
jgi:D-beta-D-heptose 7-phosphate kinase/D-beta-D-heptose 1-phosphate adenosyltransferase